ncbi:hypothetical protein BT96DRAFT_977304 [Gymnopus androsaceus JB14]|uniref:Uncharacterized protein n=1 Tax=Gymnopus androsaceus JB14 TaxID=1447944 RepID=A0A6A4HGN0_9AGAR|nr:hypothetical protein BT96DRAFT_977304 [Gymnopus androsaceus JB14]
MQNNRRNSQTSQGNNPAYPPPPQYNATSPHSSAGISHSNTSQSTPGGVLIRGEQFAGASGLVFGNRNKFRHIDGDYDESSDEEDPADYPTQELPRPVAEPYAPGTVIDRRFFAGSSNVEFSGRNDFITAQGNRTKDNRRRDSSNHTSSAPRYDSPPTEGTHIIGDHFAGLRGGTFAGPNNFTSVTGKIHKNRSKVSSRAPQGTGVNYDVSSQADVRVQNAHHSHTSTTSHSGMPHADHPNSNRQMARPQGQETRHPINTQYNAHPPSSTWLPGLEKKSPTDMQHHTDREQVLYAAAQYIYNQNAHPDQHHYDPPADPYYGNSRGSRRSTK